MPSRVTTLEWDSHFFGFKVGRLLPGPWSAADLEEALQEARAGGYRVLYGNTMPDPAQEECLADAGGLLADKRRTYVRDLSGLSGADLVVNWFIESYRKPRPDAALEELALAAGQYSRFRRDPGFGQQAFERLYRTWIARAVDRSYARELLCIEDFGVIRAMMTLDLQNGRPDIGLIATAASHRGRGMAADLVKAGLVWAINRGYEEAQVCTQAENTAACAFYEAMGYRLEREEWIVHFWC